MHGGMNHEIKEKQRLHNNSVSVTNFLTAITKYSIIILLYLVVIWIFGRTKFFDRCTRIVSVNEVTKMAFTKEEFDIMIDELLYREPVSFDMLCHIAEKTLRPTVRMWCNEEPCLRGRECEHDIMQEIHLRLMKVVVSRFLLRNGVDAPVNYDPEGFKSWLFTVAKNLKKDFANNVRNDDFKTVDIDTKLSLSAEVEDDAYDSEERQAELKDALHVVLSADVSIYKVLTWIAQFLFIIDYDITKIKSNEVLIKLFEEKTLFEMFDTILILAERIPWLELSASQKEKINKALHKPWNETLVYGDVKYSEFFMKVKGEKSGKKSISDWVNRMNNIIRRKTGKDFSIKPQKSEEGQ